MVTLERQLFALLSPEADEFDVDARLATAHIAFSRWCNRTSRRLELGSQRWALRRQASLS
jgi:hypothetical protein